MYKIFKFDINISRIILNYLNDRSFFVSMNDSNSMTRDVAAGVPQGSLLGPVLYNILLADLPDPPSDNTNVIALTYADDIMILGSLQNAKKANNMINKYLTTLSNFFSKWKLKINVSKCECTTIKGLHKYLYPNARTFIANIQINGNRIPVKEELKYLGVILQSKFNFKTHLDYVIKKAKNMFFSYISLIKRAKDLKSVIKISIYKQIIRPILTYAFPIWFSISSAQMERLRIFERYILRICTGVNREPYHDGDLFRKRTSNKILYKKCKITRIDKYLMDNALRFLNKLTILSILLLHNICHLYI
ncbi:unnamed protein product [Ceratitis capitata]|uniref:(Mediterranean fruit fly) hypothetical protein n=1 Tax=Ceratitis capitata TaxID=7213 RepID=A0A811V618_CERCA|nr:unnamed protein product [Ceratitis capitata]